MKGSILIIDNNTSDNQEIHKVTWGRVGCHVKTASDIQTASLLLEECLTDIMLIIIRDIIPHHDLVSGIRQIRQITDIPLIVYTSQYNESRNRECILAGADLYLSHSNTANEEFYTGYALMRRQKLSEARFACPCTQKFPWGLVIHLRQRRAIFKGKDMNLKRREFDLLRLLAKNKNFVLEYAVIYENVWGNEYDSKYALNQLRTSVKRLRHSFLSIDNTADVIKTVKHVGYQLIVKNV